eukprot:COSAG06_NODE_2208_length_7340_cov_3.553515_6_plen_36_part_00
MHEKRNRTIKIRVDATVALAALEGSTMYASVEINV